MTTNLRLVVRSSTFLVLLLELLVLFTPAARRVPSLGRQHLYEQNVKDSFEDTATGPAIPTLAPTSANSAKLTDHGFTARVMFGF